MSILVHRSYGDNKGLEERIDWIRWEGVIKELIEWLVRVKYDYAWVSW